MLHDLLIVSMVLVTMTAIIPLMICVLIEKRFKFKSIISIYKYLLFDEDYDKWGKIKGDNDV